MKITFWKSFGMGVADIQLPPQVLASFKREFAEEMHTLKYIIFNVRTRQASVVESDELDQILELANSAKRFNLNLKEFKAACKSFCEPGSQSLELTTSKAAQLRSPAKRMERLLLPPLKPGHILFRRDSRRKGSCKIIRIEENIATVVWKHSGKHTKINLINLRNPVLYSTSTVF